jgi:hypothetical protein
MSVATSRGQYRLCFHVDKVTERLCPWTFRADVTPLRGHRKYSAMSVAGGISRSSVYLVQELVSLQ